jgi:hypothetical protein
MDGHALTFITANAPVSDTFQQDEAGQLQRTPGRPLSFGLAQIVQFPGIRALAAFLGGLGPNQYLQPGIFEDDATGIVSPEIDKRMRADPEFDDRVRTYFKDLPVQVYTGKNVSWPDEPAWMKVIVRIKTDDGAHEIFDRTVPELNAAPHLIVDDPNSYIFDADGRQLRGEGWKHVYFPVTNGTDVPRAITAWDRLAVARGYANYEWSVHGFVIMPYSAISMTTASRMRPDRAAPAVCVSPLEQHRPEPRLYNPDAEPADLRQVLHELTEEEEAAWAREDATARERLWRNPPAGARRRQERPIQGHEARAPGRADRARDARIYSQPDLPPDENEEAPPPPARPTGLGARGVIAGAAVLAARRGHRPIEEEPERKEEEEEGFEFFGEAEAAEIVEPVEPNGATGPGA